jgi:hypothetical protein
MASGDVTSALQQVMQEWSSHAQISYSPTTVPESARSIDVSFPSGDHGDGYPFSVDGAVLAHTFYPPPNPEPIAGDMHVNYDEAWSLSGSLQLYPVMLHEMGHALGLGHTDDPSAVMYPYYQGLEHLSSLDIQALQTLYAAPAADSAPAAPVDSGGIGSGGTGSTPSTPSAPSTPAPTPPSSGVDRTPPSIQIYAPAMAASLTYESSLTVQGFATDNVGVTQILWSSSAGGSGSAAVANPFVISDIPLVPGVNQITIQASDAAGNTGSALLTVTRK